MEIWNVKLKDFLFFSALTFYCLYYFLNTSLFGPMFPGALRLVRMIVVALVFMKWMIAERYTEKKIWIWGVLLLSLVSIIVIGRYKVIFMSICLIISGQDIDFEKIVKALFLNTIIWSLLIAAACTVGIIPDYIYDHQLGGKIMTAHSLGFKYYSTLGYFSMAVTMMWIYLRKKVHILELIVLAVCNYLLFLVHTTNLSFYLTLLFMAAYFCVEKVHLIRFADKFWKFFATILPFSLCSITVLIVFAYKKGLFKVGISWMNTIVGRLEYSVEAIERYGIHMFSTRVEQLGNTALVYGGESSAFYIDSGYVYSIIAYGIFFTVISLMAYTVLLRYLYMTKQRVLYLWIVTMLFASIMNNFLYDIINNPVLFLIPVAVLGNKGQERERKYL